MIQKYKHVIWDWNGTLFNDAELCVDIINGVLFRRSLPPLTLKKYRDIFTFPVEDYYKATGLDFSIYPFKELGREWMNEYEIRKKEVSLFKDAQKILEKISKLKVGQSILSAYSQHSLEEIVNQFKINHYFTHLVGLDHIYATSKLELGIDLMEKLGNGKGETLLIGDTKHDFDVASEIGADCILIASGHQSKSKLEECGVEVFDSLEELIL